MCKCSCTLYIALFSVLLAITIGIGTVFVYWKYMNHDKKKSCLKRFYRWGNNLLNKKQNKNDCKKYKH